MVTIDFKHGTLIIQGDADQVEPVSMLVKFDKRINSFRAKAYKYAQIVTVLHQNGNDYQDRARKYTTLNLRNPATINPHRHQKRALQAWVNSKCRGLVVLPTGSGKSFLAIMAMTHVQRSTLVIVPTIDLVHQWSGLLERFFKCKVGMVGGGSKDVSNITVSTYDSAVLMMEFIGDKFGLVIFDECHHLPGPNNSLAATMCLAPYRLGLTATPERNDDGEKIIHDLIGDLCYREDIDELEGQILSPYITHKLELDLDKDEAEEYERNRQLYLEFVRSQGIDFSSRYGWANFISLSYRTSMGKDAFAAYLTQKRIARTCRAKFDTIWKLIRKHAGERILIFTADNQTAYEIGRRFFIPVLTHHTKVIERKEFLESFREGIYPALVTSKVLNEGVDVPEAAVAIIVSGSGSVREHVQRLGRILRRADNKQAHLYELLSKGTSEIFISNRRTKHRAYKRTNKM